jgi:hypothetical protein
MLPSTGSGTPDSRWRWTRAFWIGAGAVCLLLGVVGLLLPLLPTTPFVLLAAGCFARGSERCERWLLEHPYFGPKVRDWRENRAVPRAAKWWATLAMALSSAWAWWVLPGRVGWLPAACCALVALWLWRLPTSGRVPGGREPS